MEKISLIYWKEADFWIGYLQDYPDYRTQGETLDELKENILDIYHEIASGNIEVAYR